MGLGYWIPFYLFIRARTKLKLVFMGVCNGGSPRAYCIFLLKESNDFTRVGKIFHAALLFALALFSRALRKLLKINWLVCSYFT